MKDYILNDDVTFCLSAENKDGRPNGGSNLTCQKPSPCITVNPGETAVIADVKGSGLIQHIWFGFYVGHSFILRMYWDDEKTPSVECPLSAFFGRAFDENNFDSNHELIHFASKYLISAPAQGYNSYFKMPFKKHCLITLENRSKEAKTIYYAITGVYTKLEDNIGYFHASYRQSKPVQKGEAYVAIDGIEGQGRFLGITLAVGLNGNATCFVEGEPKMYIDGEEKPSINYTGTEDYFCGSFAFGNDILAKKYCQFCTPFFGLAAVIGDMNENYNNQQRFLLYRFHHNDVINFKKSFKFTLDNFGWTGPRYDDYISVCYWYQTKHTKPLQPLPSDEECCMK